MEIYSWDYSQSILNRITKLLDQKFIPIIKDRDLYYNFR